MVEQDAWQGPSLEAARESRMYLRSLGWLCVAEPVVLAYEKQEAAMRKRMRMMSIVLTLFVLFSACTAEESPAPDT